MTKYIVNESKQNIGVFQGKYLIPIGGWIALDDEEANREEIKEAKRRGWISVQLVEPAASEPFKPDLSFQTPPTAGSATIPGKAAPVAAKPVAKKGKVAA